MNQEAQGFAETSGVAAASRQLHFPPHTISGPMQRLDDSAPEQVFGRAGASYFIGAEMGEIEGDVDRRAGARRG